MLAGRVFPESLYNVVLFFVTVKRFSAAQEENRRQAPLQDPTLKRPDSGGIYTTSWLKAHRFAIPFIWGSGLLADGSNPRSRIPGTRDDH
jgi:hypothetical protein